MNAGVNNLGAQDHRAKEIARMGEDAKLDHILPSPCKKRTAEELQEKTLQDQRDDK